MTQDQVETVNLDGWVLRVRKPQGDAPHPVLLLLHGLTGDEDVMWIFTQRLARHYLTIAPRGLYSSSLGGYSWYHDQANDNPHVDDYRGAIDALLDLLQPGDFPTADFSRLSIVGFSQGAALAYTYAALHADKVHSLAGLAGFAPGGFAGLTGGRPLQGKPVFVAHGSEDETVPVERARRSVELLEQAGAQVVYCEEAVGHKLGSSCFRSMEAFFDQARGKE